MHEEESAPNWMCLIFLGTLFSRTRSFISELGAEGLGKGREGKEGIGKREGKKKEASEFLNSVL